MVEHKRGISSIFNGKSFFRYLQKGSRVQINSTKENCYKLSVKTNSLSSLFEVIYKFLEGYVYSGSGRLSS